MFTVPTHARLSAVAVLAAASLAACASSDDATEAGSATNVDVAIVDAWTKATDSGMTATFGEITNEGDEAITLIAATTDASSMVELHETSMDDAGGMSMSEKDGGFTIEAGDTLVLEPGGNHIMLMGVTDPIEAGADVPVTLEFEGGGTVEMDTVAKDYTGANEEYVGDKDHGSMEHSGDAGSDEDHSGNDH
ncbi:copper chaperone PCu(A)C [Demequina globuliformis]|uniref:copper chaperone PCu(A)C n=1 Tax=Demequina globuliformis TaxID=676202 RepID=UPI000A043672|nr:copper chaperone PCu(A)C [Demequina globuliformis]